MQLVAACEVWEALINTEMQHAFFSLGMEEWVMLIMSARRSGGSFERWAGRIMSICWWQWRWRNAEIFRGERMGLAQKIRLLIGSLEEVNEAFKLEAL